MQLDRIRRARFAAPFLCLAPIAAAAQSDLGAVSIAEVFYDAVGSDDELEWVELANDGDFAVDLAGWTLGWGGSDYTSGLLALEGVIAAGTRFVVGGPLASEANAQPVFGFAVDLEPDLQNSGATADGIALFDVPIEEVSAESIPVSAVVYGGENASGLLDETGAISAVHVADAPGGHSIERQRHGAWIVQPLPTPGVAPVPEPARLVLALGGVVGLAIAARAGALTPQAAGRTAASSAGRR